jgi:hypothetical protein
MRQDESIGLGRRNRRDCINQKAIGKKKKKEKEKEKEKHPSKKNSH